MAEDAPERVAEVLRSGYVGQGPKCAQFETEFAALIGAEQPPLLVNSCTSAITLALWLAGVRAGDRVITTPMTCSATNTPITNLQAKVLWADVDPKTGLIDPESVERLLKEHPDTKAVIAVDWGGAPCDYAALKAICKPYGIPVIQDAAHRVFALNGEHGDYVAWSFQAIKHLTMGDGGALLTPPEEYERAKLLRWYGLDRESSADFRCSQSISEAGFKFQSNDIAAAIGLANIGAVRDNIRLATMNSYEFTVLCENPKVLQPKRNPFSDWWLHTTRVKDRTGFIAHMAEYGVKASPVHRRNDEHACFAQYRRHLPGVDEFASTNVCVPNGHWLTNADRERVVEAVNAWK